MAWSFRALRPKAWPLFYSISRINGGSRLEFRVYKDLDICLSIPSLLSHHQHNKHPHLFYIFSYKSIRQSFLLNFHHEVHHSRYCCHCYRGHRQPRLQASSSPSSSWLQACYLRLPSQWSGMASMQHCRSMGRKFTSEEWLSNYALTKSPNSLLEIVLPRPSASSTTRTAAPTVFLPTSLSHKPTILWQMGFGDDQSDERRISKFSTQRICGLHCLTAQSEHKVYDINYGHSLGHWIYTNKVKFSIFRRLGSTSYILFITQVNSRSPPGSHLTITSFNFILAWKL